MEVSSSCGLFCRKEKGGVRICDPKMEPSGMVFLEPLLKLIFAKSVGLHCMLGRVCMLSLSRQADCPAARFALLRTGEAPLSATLFLCRFLPPFNVLGSSKMPVLRMCVKRCLRGFASCAGRLARCCFRVQSSRCLVAPIAAAGCLRTS